jgi:UDP-GlcNAc:undecaprenyl-phosphate GlcNAc-1-phosphate transferase
VGATQVALITTLLSAFAFATVLTFIAIKLSRWLNILAVPDARRKHVLPTPKLGVIPLFGAFVLAVLIGQAFGLPTNDPNEGRRWAGFLLGGAVIAATAFLDDKLHLSPPPQFLAQAIAAVIAILSLIFIERFTDPFLGREIVLWQEYGAVAGYTLLVVFTGFWFIGMMNTVNWLDGVDGLAATVAAIASAVTLIHMLREGQYSVALLPAALIGTLVGFLVFNFQPARIFIGGGALWLGFALACIGIIGGAKIALLLLVMGLPIADVAWQVFDRWRHGRSPAQSDRGHLHFRLADAGWSARQIVALYAGACALFGAVALVPQPPLFKLITLAVLFGVVIVVLARLSQRQK